MKPHIPEKAWHQLELASNVNEAEHHQQSAAVRYYGAALMAGLAMFGPASTVAGAEHEPTNIATHRVVHFPPLPLPVVPRYCRPSPEFKVGLKDDAAIEDQVDGPRSRVFRIAKKRFGIRVVSMDVDFGKWERAAHQRNKTNIHNYINEIKTATSTAIKAGLEVHWTLMPTARYEKQYSQKLSFRNPDPQIMKSFAYNTLSEAGTGVSQVSIGIAPNDPVFLKSVSKQQYGAEFLAGRAGALAASPHIKVIAGELDPRSVPSLIGWIKYLNTLPQDGIALHAYQLLNKTPEFEKYGVYYITEYGDPSNDPNQAKNDALAKLVAFCYGIKEFDYYQFYRNPKLPHAKKASWDTGVVNPPPSTGS